jgi:hypothetical protein
LSSGYLSARDGVVGDDGERPLDGDGMAQVIGVIGCISHDDLGGQADIARTLGLRPMSVAGQTRKWWGFRKQSGVPAQADIDRLRAKIMIYAQTRWAIDALHRWRPHRARQQHRRTLHPRCSRVRTEAPNIGPPSPRWSNDVDPLGYLTDVLTRIVNGHSNRDIDQLLPWAYRKQDLKAVA